MSLFVRDNTISWQSDWNNGRRGEREKERERERERARARERAGRRGRERERERERERAVSSNKDDPSVKMVRVDHPFRFKDVKFFDDST